MFEDPKLERWGVFMTKSKAATVLGACNQNWKQKKKKEKAAFGWFLETKSSLVLRCSSEDPTLPSVITGCAGASLTYRADLF